MITVLRETVNREGKTVRLVRDEKEYGVQIFTSDDRPWGGYYFACWREGQDISHFARAAALECYREHGLGILPDHDPIIDESGVIDGSAPKKVNGND